MYAPQSCGESTSGMCWLPMLVAKWNGVSPCRTTLWTDFFFFLPLFFADLSHCSAYADRSRTLKYRIILNCLYQQFGVSILLVNCPVVGKIHPWLECTCWTHSSGIDHLCWLCLWFILLFRHVFSSYLWQVSAEISASSEGVTSASSFWGRLKSEDINPHSSAFCEFTLRALIQLGDHSQPFVVPSFSETTRHQVQKCTTQKWMVFRDSKNYFIQAHKNNKIVIIMINFFGFS